MDRFNKNYSKVTSVYYKKGQGFRKQRSPKQIHRLNPDMKKSVVIPPHRNSLPM